MKHRATAFLVYSPNVDDDRKSPPPLGRVRGEGRVGKRGPQQVTTTEGERFQVKGEDTLYEDPCDAIRRARKLGNGAEVIRLSDRKRIAIVLGYIPAPPKEWT
jgi:hypothetical protein